MTDSLIRKVCEIFAEINYDWLITGEGEMRKQPNPQAVNPAQHVSDIVSMPREVWNLIQAKDRQMDEMVASLKAKDDQVERLIVKIDARNEKMEEAVELLKEHIKKGENATNYGHVAIKAG